MGTMMKTGLLLLILWAGTDPRVKAGSPQGASGGDCKSAMDQHHVILTVPDDENGHCSGILIKPKWVVSAAQCDHDDLEVILNRGSKNGEKRKIQKKHLFSDKKGSQHDLMLLEVELKASDKFPFASLPNSKSCSPPAKSTAVQFTGWASEFIDFKDNTVTPQTLKCGSVSISACEDMSRYTENPEPDIQAYAHQKLLCTSHPTDACDLLSGGALVKDGLVYGVLVISDMDCEEALEFVDICHKEYRDWINKLTGQ